MKRKNDLHFGYRLILSLLSIGLLLGSQFGCGKDELTTEKDLESFTRTYVDYFDTVTTITLFAEDETDANRYYELVEEDLEKYHQLYNTYESYPGINNVRTINENAGKQPVQVDPAIIDLMEQCLTANKRTKGAVNMAIGPVTVLWHDAREAGLENPDSAAIPEAQALQAANRFTDIQRVEVDREAGTVYLPLSEMRLDVGSGSKGLAGEKIARHLEAEGVQSAMISLGGNVRVIGGKGKEAKNWAVGIQNPDTSGIYGAHHSSEQGAQSDLLYVLEVKDKAVVTSGIYQRGFYVGDRYYHHIIDPITLAPSTRYDSVTVVCNDSGLADSLTTALFNSTVDEGKAIIEEIPDVEVLWVKGEEHWTTDGFLQFVRK